MIKIWRKVTIIVLPTIAVVAGVMTNIQPDIPWVSWIFKIFLSGTVGIWTNYFAIKMLFRPYERTAFGRQGLIPAKRDEIAVNIGETVSSELLNSETLLNYVEENKLVERGATELLEFLHNWVHKAENRTKLVDGVGNFIQKNGTEHIEKLLEHVGNFASTLIKEKLSIDTTWPFIRDAIHKELEKPETKKLATDIIAHLLDKNTPAIASYVNEFIENWIMQQSILANLALNIGKMVMGIDEEHISRELQNAIRKPEFLDKLIHLVDDNIMDIAELIEKPEVKEKLKVIVDEQRVKLENWVTTDGIDIARNKILELLESDTFWQWLDEQLDTVVIKVKETAEKKIQSKEFHKTANDFVIKIAAKFDIKEIVRQKVSEFELAKLEDIIKEASDDNLCGIELFGGILGLIAGSTLISFWFIPGIPVFILIVWSLEKALRRKKV